MSDKYKMKYCLLKQHIYDFIGYRFFHHKLYGKRWAGRPVLSVRETNEYIYDAVMAGRPFMAARYGLVEMEAVVKREITNCEGPQSEDFYQKMLNSLNVNAGMFSNDLEGAFRFAELYAQCAGEADLLGIWQDGIEEYILKKYSPKSALTALKNLEPYYEEEVPWSRALKGKRVLVIHPFADTIRAQYETNRDKIWNENILPEFELITYKALQTQGDERDERFSTWFQALDYMKEEISNIDFDVALIGCGAYGLPLAEAVKKMGKQAIHLGGSTQIMFGIKGKRWESMDFFVRNMNEYWVRPSANEIPKGASKVEEGCYW